MLCPHCHGTIREEDRYIMSRDPHAELTPGRKRFGVIGGCAIAVPALAFLFHLLLIHLP